MNQRDVKLPIADVQSTPDTRRLAIDRVGIKSIRHPAKIKERDGGVQHTVAHFNMYVGLPHHFKGTHMSRFVGIEELIDLAENEASCQLYGLLKRPDEKFVTENAYDNPKFVEDMVRDIAARLNSDKRVTGYVVESENFESIHNHSAYAMIAKGMDA